MLPLSRAGVQLRPLTRADLHPLFTVTPPDTFQFFLDEPREWTLEEFAAWADRNLFRPDQQALLVRDSHTGVVLGSTSLMDIQPAHRHVEIGCTWYAASQRGTHVNPACKLLLLEHAFTTMFDGQGAIRVTLKCDARNFRSQAAITKLGAVREGTLRRHRVRPDGFVRDTVYFSILPEEWPGVRSALTGRIHALAHTE